MGEGTKGTLGRPPSRARWLGPSRGRAVRCEPVRWLLAGALLLPVLACKDTVRIVNSAGNEHGVLLDGHTDGINANDKTFVSLATDIDVGPVNGSAVHNELIGFTNRRPTAVRVAPGWGNAADTVNLTFPDEIAIPVTVRIVRGPFDAQRQRALDASITTSAIWSSERMGVRFAPFEILDATTDPDASNYFDFTCSQRTGIQNDIGRTNGRINIYYVDTVDGGTGRGQACQIGSDFVAMGRATGDELLSHELGHDFGLTHIDTLTSNFDQTNIMHSASNTRAFVTEGQLFRSHLAPASALNAVYNARPGLPTRDCGRDEATPFCPTVEKRIWADGTFPAN